MGKILDKLARRNDPLRLAALALHTQALHCMADDSNDEALDMLGENLLGVLESHSPQDWAVMLDCIESRCQSERDFDALDMLREQIVVEASFVHDDQGVGRELFALPLSLVGMPVEAGAGLTPAQLRDLDTVMRKHLVIGPDLSCTLLPILVPCAAVGHFGAHALYRMGKLLAAGDCARAVALLGEQGVPATLVGGATLRSKDPSGQTSVTGAWAVIGVIERSEVDDTYPLSATTLELMRTPVDSEEEEAALDDELQEEEAKLLELAAEELSPVLGAETVRIWATSCGWLFDHMACGLAARAVSVGADLLQATQSGGLQNPHELCASPVLLAQESPPALRLELRRLDSGATLQELIFPAMPWESVEEAVDSLESMLRAHDIPLDPRADVDGTFSVEPADLDELTGRAGRPSAQGSDLAGAASPSAPLSGPAAAAEPDEEDDEDDTPPAAAPTRRVLH